MPKVYKRKTKQTWGEEDVNMALADIRNGCSIRSAAKTHKMSELCLRYRMKLLQDGKDVGKSGRKQALNAEVEMNLANCINKMCDLGFSPSTEEVKVLVADYIAANEIRSSYFNNGRPGKDWLSAFLKRNNLSLKKAEMISVARKSATENPFVIFDYYEKLENIIKTRKLSPSAIWNCDESGFPTDPLKARVISGKGKHAFRVTSGPGRENITTLAVCNAAGRVLDPLIIFSGKNLQSTWRGEKALSNTWYGISESGWMTTELFSSWFLKFLNTVTERPLVLVFDGHMTHVSINVIQRAMEDDVILLKLPSHTTDKLQPLDVGGFGPLKRLWEKTLNDWLSKWGPREPMKKAQFCNLLGEIWHKGLSPKNIMAGFEKTGLYPVDKNKYPIERLDKRLIKRYNAWIASGRDETIKDDLAFGNLATPRKEPLLPKNVPALTPTQDDEASTLSSLLSSTDVPTARLRLEERMHSTPVSGDMTPTVQQIIFHSEIPPKPAVAPEGKKWVPIVSWILVDKDPVSLAPQPGPSSERSFEELVLDKMKGPTNKPTKTRRKCDIKAKIITDPEYLQSITEAEQEKSKKKKKDPAEKKPPTKKCNPREKNSAASRMRKLAQDIGKASESDNDSEISSDEFNDSEENVETEIKDIPNFTKAQVKNTHTKEELVRQLKDIVSSLDDDKRGYFYSVYYGQQFFWGKVQHVFAPDVDADVEQVELKFLRYRGDNIFDFPAVPDIETVEAKYLFLGPCVPSETISGRGYKIREDGIARARYVQLKKWDIYGKEIR